MLRENSEVSRSNSALKRRVDMGLVQSPESPPAEEVDIEAVVMGENDEEHEDEEE